MGRALLWYNFRVCVCTCMHWAAQFYTWRKNNWQSLSRVQFFVDCSPPGSSVHGIFPAWLVQRFAIPFSRGSSEPRDQICIPYVAGRFFTTEPIAIIHTKNLKCVGKMKEGNLHRFNHACAKKDILPMSLGKSETWKPASLPSNHWTSLLLFQENIYLFGCAESYLGHMGSWFSDLGSNPGPLATESTESLSH